LDTYEKLGVFYLGREVDPASGERTDRPLLYESKDLTTHAVVVGMTGSGKTGLCVSLLEEAALDRIPVIAVDPKGDLGNLLLTFPSLEPSDFRPWIDEAAALASGESADEHSRRVATSWREGLAAWDQDGERIRRLRDAADFAVYTPGGSAGMPLALLRSLAAPGAGTRADAESLRERVEATASGLLFLTGLEADPVQSREHILVSSLLDHAWREGRSLDLAALIRAIQAPPFERVGVLDVESFFPASERFALAMRVNNLLASPAFAAWREGEPLEASRLLYAADGKPRVSVLSLAHLDDAQRMFFVTLLLGEVISWMRAQPGTGSLRAILLMDEVFGFLPPTANPPSKRPLLTLLKQARAYGVGVALSTQNPVDLDYKALSNAGTWMIGRLQTERDVLRVLDGLEGASAAGGAAFDRGATQTTIAGLGKRRFLLHDVHESAPALFETRWCMSYLAGPMTRVQIERLMAPRKAAASAAPAPAVPAAAAAPAGAGPAQERPVLPPAVPQAFLPGAGAGGGGARVYRPALLGAASLHFVDARAGIDAWEDRALLAPLEDAGADPWEGADPVRLDPRDLAKEPEGAARWEPPPPDAARPAAYEAWGRALANRLYRDATLAVWRSADPAMTSSAGEEESAFRARVAQKRREARDLRRETLRERYAAKLATLQERVRRDEQRVEREKSQQGQQTFQAAVSVGATVLGALLGRKAISSGSVGRASTAMRSAGRAAREKEDVRHATETLEAGRARLAGLERELEDELASIGVDVDPAAVQIETAAIKPRKTDIKVAGVWLLWTPWRSEAAGALRPDWRTA
jgi:hypothetical protein